MAFEDARRGGAARTAKLLDAPPARVVGVDGEPRRVQRLLVAPPIDERWEEEQAASTLWENAMNAGAKNLD